MNSSTCTSLSIILYLAWKLQYSSRPGIIEVKKHSISRARECNLASYSLGTAYCNVVFVVLKYIIICTLSADRYALVSLSLSPICKLPGIIIRTCRRSLFSCAGACGKLQHRLQSDILDNVSTAFACVRGTDKCKLHTPDAEILVNYVGQGSAQRKCETDLLRHRCKNDV